jgi:sphingomyelin phosphodiesterase
MGEILLYKKKKYGTIVTTPLTNATAKLCPQFRHNVTAILEDDDVEFQAYNARKTRGYNPPTCTGTCKEVETCQLRTPQSQFDCVNAAVNVPASKKRDLWVQPEDCHNGLVSKPLGGLKVEPVELRRLMRKYR